jgi:hypothetical protein
MEASLKSPPPSSFGLSVKPQVSALAGVGISGVIIVSPLGAPHWKPGTLSIVGGCVTRCLGVCAALALVWMWSRRLRISPS